jgi:hypothetical protein
LHSVGRFLIGFDGVTRQGPLLTDIATYLNEDRYAGVPLASSNRDATTPGVEAFERRDYEEAVFQGIPWKRLRTEVSGTRDAAGNVASEQTDYLSYVEGRCPEVVKHTQASGVLTTTTSYVSLSRFGQALTCLWTRAVEQGQHADPSLDFRHETAVSRKSRA